MLVTYIREHNDKSAEVALQLTPQEVGYLINVGLNYIINLSTTNSEQLLENPATESDMYKHILETLPEELFHKG
jgi:hypothetical protein